jgi:hypothetical protein
VALGSLLPKRARHRDPDRSVVGKAAAPWRGEGIPGGRRALFHRGSLRRSRRSRPSPWLRFVLWTKSSPRCRPRYFNRAPEDGRPHQEDNFFARERTNIGSPKPLTAGRHTVRCEFIRALAALGAGGRCMLLVDGELVAEGFIPKTQPFAFPGDEGTDVGLDGGTMLCRTTCSTATSSPEPSGR